MIVIDESDHVQVYQQGHDNIDVDKNEVYVTDDSECLQVNSQAFYESEHIEVTQKNFIRVM